MKLFVFGTTEYVKNDINTGFFILRFELSESYPPLENALFSDVSEEECFYVKRGDRPYTDRMCHRPFSLVRHGHAIGVRKKIIVFISIQYMVVIWQRRTLAILHAQTQNKHERRFFGKLMLWLLEKL